MHEGDAEVALHTAQLLAHLDAEEFVQRRQRLVKQQHARLGNGRAGQCDTLRLSTGEGDRPGVLMRGKVHFLQDIPALLPCPLAPQTKHHVVEDARPRQEARVLVDHGPLVGHLDMASDVSIKSVEGAQ